MLEPAREDLLALRPSVRAELDAYHGPTVLAAEVLPPQRDVGRALVRERDPARAGARLEVRSGRSDAAAAADEPFAREARPAARPTVVPVGPDMDERLRGLLAQIVLTVCGRKA